MTIAEESKKSVKCCGAPKVVITFIGCCKDTNHNSEDCCTTVLDTDCCTDESSEGSSKKSTEHSCVSVIVNSCNC